MTMKFFTRDLLFLTMIVAILAAWWIDHWRQARDIQQLIFDLQSRGYFY